jgi:3-oxo-5-alpha-steroid 4-dehydrogenase 1
MTYQIFQNLIYGWMALGAVTFCTLLRITAPYGRHANAKWGLQINNRLGWILMESPVMIMLLHFVITNSEKQTQVTWTLVGFFLFHYIHRTFIFPFRIRTRGKKMPLIIVCSAICFNLANGFFLGYYFANFANYPPHYFTHPQFIIGAILFATGFYVNWIYDNKLIHLRKPGDINYVIPGGGLFNLISCPNLFGEIIEWTGYALLCWNLPALSFLVWTLANLIPRALAHHRWYKEKFETYPRVRMALFPFLV